MEKIKDNDTEAKIIYGGWGFHTLGVPFGGPSEKDCRTSPVGSPHIASSHRASSSWHCGEIMPRVQGPFSKYWLL